MNKITLWLTTLILTTTTTLAFENPINMYTKRWNIWSFLGLVFCFGLWLWSFDKRRKEDGHPGLFEGDWW